MVISETKSTDPPPPDPAPTASDDASVNTEHTANGGKKNDLNTIDFCVKVEFVAKNADSPVPVMKLHRDLILTLITAHTTALVIYDNHDHVITAESLAKLRTLADYQRLFDVLSRTGSKTRPGRHIVAMKLTTALTLADLKYPSEVSKFLRDNRIYLRLHPFPLKVIDTLSPGWLQGRHPTQSDSLAAKLFINRRIKKINPDAVIPEYHLIYSSPSRLNKDGTKITTKAYEVQVDRRNSQALDKMLKAAFHGEPVYVKWKYRHTKPELFRDAMVLQSKYLSECMTVPVHGVTEKQMKFLVRHIIIDPSCISVERTRTTDISGRWNVLSTVKDFRAATIHVRSVLARFEEIVPKEFATTPPTWKKWNEDAQTLDASSQGDQSFISTSARSFASMVTEADRANEARTPAMHIDVSFLSTDQPTATSAVTDRMSEQDMLIKSLTAQVSVLTALVETLTAAAKTVPSATSADQALPPPLTAVDPSLSHISSVTSSVPPSDTTDRVAILEQQVLQLLQAQSTKRSESELEPVVSALQPPSKKVDTKATPSKSPYLDKAKAHQTP